MYKGLSVSVVIPTLNEAEGIRSTLEAIPSFVDEVVVVDGNSRDQTREIAASCGAKVILEKRRGYGRAFKTGFAHCRGEIIATGDGDGTYPIELVGSAIDHLLEQKLDFLSCNRMPLNDRRAMKPVNWFGNKMMTLAASALWGHGFRDILSGMWVFRRSCLSELELRSETWNLSEEIKLQAFMKLGRRFGEFHIPYRERLGETKLMPWKVGVENLVYLFAMRTGTVAPLRKLLGKPVFPAEQVGEVWEASSPSKHPTL